jgi:hypothetical protein
VSLSSLTSIVATSRPVPPSIVLRAVPREERVVSGPGDFDARVDYDLR